MKGEGEASQRQYKTIKKPTNLSALLQVRKSQQKKKEENWKEDNLVVAWHLMIWGGCRTSKAVSLWLPIKEICTKYHTSGRLEKTSPQNWRI